jgi:hypothetical protein
LERKRGLAGAGLALNQMNAVGTVAAGENVIETVDAGRDILAADDRIFLSQHVVLQSPGELEAARAMHVMVHIASN